MSSYDAGRCRRTIDAMDAGACVEGMRCDHIIASAIDRLAADVAEVKEAVCDGSVAEERDRFFAGWAAALNERDKLRAEVEKLKAMLEQQPSAAPQPDGTGHTPDQSDWLMAGAIDRLAAELAARQAANHPGTLDSSPAAPQPAAPPAGWLTDRERHVLSSMLPERPCDWSLHWADDVQPVFRAILARAGSPPVVEVPALGFLGYMTGREQGIVLAYRDALDAAGVPWKEVPRE